MILPSFNISAPQVIESKIENQTVVGQINPKTVIELTNKARLQNGLEIVLENSTLNNAARLKAEDMVQKGYFAHKTPDGKTPWYWFGMAGYYFLNAGENLAIVTFTVGATALAIVGLIMPAIPTDQTMVVVVIPKAIILLNNFFMILFILVKFNN